MAHDTDDSEEGFVIELGGRFTDPDTGQDEYVTTPVERYDTLDEAVDAAEAFCDNVLDHIGTIFPMEVPPIDIRIVGPDGTVYERPWRRGGTPGPSGGVSSGGTGSGSGGGSSGGTGGGTSGGGTGTGSSGKKPRPPVGPNKRTWF